jgi:purine-binding chemotaxis protein CheW
VIAFRGNALILFDPAAVAAVVRRHFGDQEFLAESGQPPGPGAAWSPEADEDVFLCTRLDDLRLAIPVGNVLEVIEGHDVTPLFQMPPLVRGLLNLRGQVLACIDLAPELGLPPRKLEERNRFVVIDGAGAELALCVDRVTGIRRLPPARAQKADLVLAGELARYVAGVVEADDGTWFLLAAAAVFAAPPLQPFRSLEG